MSNKMKPLAIAAGIFFGGTVAASAAVLDFTDDSVPLSGTFGPASYEVTGSPSDPNRDEAFDGDPALASPQLELDNDGLGITNDEVSHLGQGSEQIRIEFDRDVTIRGLHFLDLFEDATEPSEEVAIVSVDGIAVPLTFGAAQPKTGDNPGYRFADTDATGRVWIFEAGPTNDQFADPDYALAALEVAPIPVPAAGLLLLGGLGALGVAKRRKG